MRRGDFAVVAAALAALVMVSGCSQPQAAPPAAAAPAAPAKIPVTTASEDARKEYLEGRSLVERLLIQDSIAHFDKAIAADPNFALAELGRANSSPTGTEFLDHLKKAVALADKASDGERLQILAANAGSSGNAREAARVSRAARRRPIRRTSARISRSARCCSASRIRGRRSSTSRRPTSSRRTTRRRTTRWATRTGRSATTTTPRRRSRSTSSSSRTIRTRTIPTASCC